MPETINSINNEKRLALPTERATPRDLGLRKLELALE
jgi:hypothetical protein